MIHHAPDADPPRDPDDPSARFAAIVVVAILLGLFLTSGLILALTGVGR